MDSDVVFGINTTETVPASLNESGWVAVFVWALMKMVLTPAAATSKTLVREMSTTLVN